MIRVTLKCFFWGETSLLKYEPYIEDEKEILEENENWDTLRRGGEEFPTNMKR